MKAQQMVEETAEIKIEEKAEQKVQKKRASVPKELKDAFNAAIDKAVDKAGKESEHLADRTEKTLRKEFKKEMTEETQARRELEESVVALTGRADDTDLKVKNIAANLKLTDRRAERIENRVDALEKKDDRDARDRLIERLGTENAALATFAGVCAGVSLVIIAFLISGRLF